MNNTTQKSTPEVAYSKNLAIMRLPLGHDLVLTKTTLADLAEQSAAAIQGSGDVLGHYVRAKLLSQYCDEVVERIKDLAVAELRERGFQHETVALTTAVTGKKYDYSASLEWQALDAEIQKLAEHKKALEDMMRKNGTAKVAHEGTMSPRLTLGK
jgi:hypothetical protein